MVNSSPSWISRFKPRERGNGVKTSTEMDKPSVRAKMLELKKVSEQMVRQARAVPVQENEQMK